MSRTLKCIVLCLTIGVFFVGTNALASGFYLNGSIGISQLDDIEGVGFDSGTSFSIGAGYNFNKYFGLEASYIDFGEADDEIISLVTVSGDAVVAAAVARYTISEILTLYLKIGVAVWDAKLSVPGFGSVSDDGTDLTWAVGKMINYNKNISSFLQYQKFTFKSDGDDVDLDNISLGLQYNF